MLNFSHWNEEKFFSNSADTIKAPLIFKIDGHKFAIISGFELHFDEIFLELKTKNIDVLIVPTVSTFESQERWRELCKVRSFTNNFYILRANRIGEYVESSNNQHIWNFYGDSFVSTPNGDIEEFLGNSEELLITTISHQSVVNARKSWGFKDLIQKRSQQKAKN